MQAIQFTAPKEIQIIDLPDPRTPGYKAELRELARAPHESSILVIDLPILYAISHF